MAPQTTTSQLNPTGRSIPGIVDSVVGRRPHTEVRLRHFINHKSHAIRVPKLSTAPQKRCNSNDTISKFEMFAQELHATFLGNHNTRPHRTPSRGHLNTGDAQAPEVPASPAATTARSTGALHPIRGTTPDQKRCIAYGSGAAPQHTRINAELANRVTPGPQPARAQDAEPVMMTPSA